MNFEFIDLSLDDRQFKGETHNKNLEDAMKQAIVNFCKSMDTGLFLLDMPTGFGKTYSVLDFMVDNYAYEAAKLDEDEQKEIAEKAAAGENVRAKEIAEKVAEKKAGDDYETPHPESITSLCYSCQKYKDCNVKTGTCQDRKSVV